ncbi:hypothetical protein [Streptococcus parauberis]|uniref:hypothetical protein n=1 Tax=Streptococcus parauberis TaxID=1348 RepID=UPI000C1CA9F0|nr:hypothetical protein [Streptococcus parauberis]PIO77943.1 hypothetical protein ADO05_02033 [Streptococcus parauberis]POS66616.1 hypothetical protein AOS90_01866 [Streptococcus parauberis]
MTLDDFKSDELYSDLLIYWYNKWDIICSNIKSGSIGTEVINIRIIIKDIINEYELNSFKSEQNRKVYIKLIQEQQKKIFLNNYKDQLKLLKNELENKKSDKINCYIIAKELEKELDGFTIRKIIFSKIYDLLREKKNDISTREKLSGLTKELILDLLTIGISIEDIEKEFKSYFQTYLLSNDGSIIFLYEYPKSIKSNNEIKSYIDNITLEKRLEKLKQSLDYQEENYQIIFPLFGVKIFSSVTYQNMEIYNPKVSSFEDEIQFENTMLTNDNSQNYADCHVKVNVSSLSLNSALNEAKRQLDILISLINIEYSNKYFEVYSDGSYQIFKDNKISSMSILPSNKYRDTNIRLSSTHANPFKIDSEAMKIIDKYDRVFDLLTNRKMVKEITTLKNVINYIEKSKYLSNEERLLNSWIIIEGLSLLAKQENDSIPQFIKKTISNFTILNYSNLELNKIFYGVADEYLGANFTPRNPNIKDDFAKKLYLNYAYSKSIKKPIKPLYDNLEKCKDIVNDIDLKDNIVKMLGYFNDNKIALEILNRKKEVVILSIDYIYKCRNQIVHNGYIDVNIIPYIVNYSESYAKSLFFEIIELYSMEIYNLKEEFIKQNYKIELLLQHLSNNNIDIFNYK